MKTLKERLLQGETIEFQTYEEEQVILFCGYNKRFCLELNGKVVKGTRTFPPILKRLEQFVGLEEIVY